MSPKLRSAVALLVVIMAGAGAADRAQAKPFAAARLTACVTSLIQAERHVAAEGTMRALRSASRMQIRFELQSRMPDRVEWRTLVAPGFGVWNSADPTVRNYGYEKRVEALTVPADYRMVVQFRWLDGSRPVARQRKVTRACRQPDLRPDLVPRGLAVKKGASKGARRYVVRLANSGESASGPFTVVLVVDGTSLPAVALPSLRPGAATRVQIAGPPCTPGSSLTVRVDADGRVDERDEDGNELVRPCAG